MSRIDLTNKQIGELTVEKYIGNNKWLCRCSCGRRKTINQYNLTTENEIYKIRSCGHIRNSATLELIGKRIDDIEVLSNEGRGRYKVRCKCGTEKIMAGHDIKKHSGTHCNHEDTSKYIGRIYGELKIIQMNGRKALCECSCGNKVWYHLSELNTPGRMSCGCLRKKKQLANSLVGRTFGLLHVEELLKDNKYRCTCKCGNEVVLKASNIRQGQQSCGCAKNRLHRASIDKMLGRVRTEEQLNALDSKENLEAFIDKYCADGKTSITKLAELLGLRSISSTAYYIDKFNLRSHILDASFTSQPEHEIESFIRSITNAEILKHDKTALGGMELDIYIPSKHIAIEYNGTYWHSDIYKSKLYHQEKTIECTKRKIRLIHIFGYEWTNCRDKIENILRNVIEDNSNIVYARGTEIHEINAAESEQFLNEYHLQNSVRSTVHIGLFLDSKLIGVMTFGTPRFNRNYQYELHRLAYKNSIRVVGGTEKMMKYFINKYNPQSIITYVDISKFTGNGYVKIGFGPIGNTKECITQPNYKWVSNDETTILSRYETQKFKLLELGLGTEDDTEDTIMRDLTYYKIYDCGNLKMEWLRRD